MIGNKSLNKNLNVKAAGFSASAKFAIEQAGGKAISISQLVKSLSHCECTCCFCLHTNFICKDFAYPYLFLLVKIVCTQENNSC